MDDFDPNLPLSEFDLADLPKDEAARRSRARATALGRQRDWQVLAMMGGDVSPEAAKAGEAQFHAATEDQRALEGMGSHVLNRALQQKQYEKELAALQQQIEYQRGQLNLQGQQLGASIMAPLIPSLLQSQTGEATMKTLAGMLGGHWGKKLADEASKVPEAKQQVIYDFLRRVGLPLEGSLPHTTVPRPKGGEPAPKAAPTQAAPVLEAGVVPPAPAKIKVRRKSDGQTGTILPGDFNDKLYEKVP
jgi:hypothetical protein